MIQSAHSSLHPFSSQLTPPPLYSLLNSLSHHFPTSFSHCHLPTLLPYLPTFLFYFTSLCFSTPLSPHFLLPYLPHPLFLGSWRTLSLCAVFRIQKDHLTNSIPQKTTLLMNSIFSICIIQQIVLLDIKNT